MCACKALSTGCEQRGPPLAPASAPASFRRFGLTPPSCTSCALRLPPQPIRTSAVAAHYGFKQTPTSEQWRSSLQEARTPSGASSSQQHRLAEPQFLTLAPRRCKMMQTQRSPRGRHCPQGVAPAADSAQEGVTSPQQPGPAATAEEDDGFDDVPMPSDVEASFLFLRNEMQNTQRWAGVCPALRFLQPCGHPNSNPCGLLQGHSSAGTLTGTWCARGLSFAAAHCSSKKSRTVGPPLPCRPSCS